MSDTSDLTETLLGNYRLLRKLGRGATAEVYLGEEQKTHEYVAVKILRSDLQVEQREKLLKRFIQEAQAAHSLVHPNVVRIIDVGEQGGLNYIVQEYVQGRNLQVYLKEQGTPSLPQALHIMKCVLSGLQAAAEAGIVHRDIKPDNILLTHTGEVKVTDFGLAQVAAPGENEAGLTQVGTTLGTPMYMSPEQVRGAKLDHRSDLYSFGVTCYHMLAGRPPFTGSNPMSVAIKHVNHNPKSLKLRRPDLPDSLCAMIDRLMAKKADERYPSARHVLRDLKRVVQELQSRNSESTDKSSSTETRQPSSGSSRAETSTQAPSKPSATSKTAPSTASPSGKSRPPAAETRVADATPDVEPSAEEATGSDETGGDETGKSSGTRGPAAIAHEPVPVRPDWMQPGSRPPREPRRRQPTPEAQPEPVSEEPALVEDAPPAAAAVAVEERDEEDFAVRSADTEFEDMDLTPMVDVTFLLLIFFMITASFSIQKTINVPAPDPDKQGAAQQIQTLEDLEADAIIVEIDAENSILVDDEMVDSPRQLPDLFQQKMTSEQKNELILEAADQALHDTVIQVIDAANDVNIERIRVVTRKEAD